MDVNPILERIRDGAPASSMPSAPPMRSAKPSVPPIIKTMVRELGLRFRPLGAENQEEYTASVALLEQDVAIIPPPLLDRAITEWVRTKRFLPRAAELIDLAQQIQRGSQQGTDAALAQLQAHCDRLNALNDGRDGWHVVGEAPNRTVAKTGERRDAA